VKLLAMCGVWLGAAGVAWAALWTVLAGGARGRQIEGERFGLWRTRPLLCAAPTAARVAGVFAFLTVTAQMVVITMVGSVLPR